MATPVSATRRRRPTCQSFLPDPQRTDRELLAGATSRRSCSDTRTCSSAAGSGTTSELLNPGSVGRPLDGDRTSAWALRRPDGEIELRRVATTVTRPRARCSSGSARAVGPAQR